MSGSELALRIAACDLAEKLKRSDQQCKYLERCRNELAKELIRVKQENQIISQEYSMMAASLGNNFAVQLCSRAKSPRSPAPGTSPVNSNENQTTTVEEDIIGKSTDWEEITAQLLNKLRIEVEQMTPKTTESDVPVSIVPEGDQRNKSVGSVLVLPTAASTTFSTSEMRSASVKEESTSVLIVRGEEDGIARGSPSDSKLGSQVDAAEVMPGRRLLTLSASNHSKESSTEREGGADKLALDQMYVKLVQDLTLDLNKFAEQVASQNEKLTRIKSKQLRSYFKRQLKPALVNENEPVRSTLAGRGVENDQYQRRQQQHSRLKTAELI